MVVRPLRHSPAEHDPLAGRRFLVHDDPDDLVAWVAALRGRVARGELDDCGTYDAGAGRLPVAYAARTILADVDHDRDLTLERRHDPFNVNRRRLLLADLRRLRNQIG